MERLPRSAQPALRSHYTRLNDGGLSADRAGAEWFPLCQALDAHGCRYLSRAPSGEPYELHPSLSNLACVASP